MKGLNGYDDVVDLCMDAMVERMDVIDSDFFELLEVMHACNDPRMDAMLQLYQQYRNTWRVVRCYTRRRTSPNPQQ